MKTVDPSLQPGPERKSRFAVVRASGDLRVVATGSFAAGERILVIDGEVVTRPSRFSVQVGDGRHLEVPPPDRDRHREDLSDHHPWRFLNHSCAPNAAVRGRDVLATRDVLPGEEITFDYETTEWELADPFPCRCTHCQGRQVRGFRHLSREEREARRPWLAEHLLRRLDEPGS